MNIKYVILSALLLVGTVMGQNWNTRYPSNVRYIAGGYSDSRPFFSTLNGALNDVKSFATSDNPYVFWLNSDTLQIADWDSIYNNGVTMSDSVYAYYVVTGKIKWAGFNIDTTKGGQGGSSILNYGSMAGTTDYYNLARWDSSGLTLSTWQIQAAINFMKLDSLLNARTLFSQVSPIYLSISGDSLYLTLPSMVFNRDSFYTIYFDSTTYIRATGAQTISGDKTIGAGYTLDFAVPAGPLAGGELLLPSGASDNPRAIWADGSWIYYRTGGKTLQVAAIDSSAGNLEEDDIIAWKNLSDATIDSILYLIKQPHISLSDDAGVTPNVTGAGTYVKITPTWTEEEKYRMTQAGDSVTISSGAAGDYFAIINFVIGNAATDDFILQVRVNNVTVHSIRFTGQGAGEYASISTQHYFSALVAGDDISLYITNTVDADDPALTYMNWYMRREHE